MNHDKNPKKSTLGRRRFLQTTGAAAAAASLPLGLTTRVRAGTMATNGRALINIFLRGGADGLVMCLPENESSLNWSTLRPDTHPTQTQSLDGYFSRPDSMSRLDQIWSDGRLAYVHGTGLGVKERSHFSAMDDWELAGHSGSGAPSGWIDRVLDLSGSSSPILGMARQSALPRSFAGAAQALPITNPAAFAWGGPPSMAPEFQDMFFHETGPAKTAVDNTFATFTHFLDSSSQNYFASYPAGNYQSDSLSQGLRDVACAIKNGLGIDAFEVDVGGWDFHNNLGPDGGGNMATKLSAVADALRDFYDDMAGYHDDYLLIIETEFGRRTTQNLNEGTDHGWGSCMIVMGGGLTPQKVHIDNRWEINKGSLATFIAAADDDLPAFVDYRHVLCEILNQGFGVALGSEMDTVFPNFTVDPGRWLGIL